MTVLLSLLLTPVLAGAQTTPPATQAPVKPLVRELNSHPDWPAAQPGDAQSARSVVAAFFAAISAPKGGTLNRERLRSLFVPDGRIAIPLAASNGKPTDVIFMSPDTYAAMSDRSTKDDGFFDHVLAMHVQQFGVAAQVVAAYESRKSPGDGKPFVRGIKSFELLNSGGRWYITQVGWVRESPDNPIPDSYLHDRSE